jgi:hypothetical protein
VDRKKIKVHEVIIFVGIVIAALFVLFGKLGYWGAILDRLDSLLELEKTGGREFTYMGYCEMILSNPMGVDVRNPDMHILEYSSVYHASHNSILTIGAQTGWAGIFAIFWLLFAQIKYLFRAIKWSQTRKDKLFAISLLMGTVAFWIHSSFHDFLQWSLIWIFFGLGMVFAADMHAKRMMETAGAE